MVAGSSSANNIFNILALMYIIFETSMNILKNCIKKYMKKAAILMVN